MAFREALGLDVTVVSTTAESYVATAARGRGGGGNGCHKEMQEVGML